MSGIPGDDGVPAADGLAQALAAGFRHIDTGTARHLWSCPDAEFLAAARPDPDWPRQYFGPAYAVLVARFDPDPAARTQRALATIRAVIAEHLTPRPRRGASPPVPRPTCAPCRSRPTASTWC